MKSELVHQDGIEAHRVLTLAQQSLSGACRIRQQADRLLLRLREESVADKDQESFWRWAA